MFYVMKIDVGAGMRYLVEVAYGEGIASARLTNEKHLAKRMCDRVVSSHAGMLLRSRVFPTYITSQEEFTPQRGAPVASIKIIADPKDGLPL